MLEEMPKWGVLRDVLEEVQAERKRLAASDDPARRKAAAAPVVVMAQEAHTCAQLREVNRRESARRFDFITKSKHCSHLYAKQYVSATQLLKPLSLQTL